MDTNKHEYFYWKELPISFQILEFMNSYSCRLVLFMASFWFPSNEVLCNGESGYWLLS
jgi:hypothetical protein